MLDPVTGLMVVGGLHVHVWLVYRMSLSLEDAILWGCSSAACGLDSPEKEVWRMLAAGGLMRNSAQAMCSCWCSSYLRCLTRH